jgi:hypothetical protein
MSTATDISKLAPMAHELIAVLPCSRTTSRTDHVVNTITGEAVCTLCAALSVLDDCEITELLED